MFSGKTLYNFAFFYRRGCDRERHLRILPSSPSQSLLRKSSSPKGRAKSTAGRDTTKKHCTFLCSAFLSGGDYRDRTGDLLHAMQALSQLS